MAVIIGNSTTVVSTLFPDGGVVSVNFGLQAQINRLWQIGSFSPYDTYSQKQKTLSLTLYGKKEDGTGGSTPIDLTPATSCSDAESFEVTINPASCGTFISPFSALWFPNSYSYSKENMGFGQENWGFTTKPELDSYTGEIVFIRGIAFGQVLIGAGMMTETDVGVVTNDADSRDSNGEYIEGESGSVSAGETSVGEYSVQREVIFSGVGGSVLIKDGYKGSATCSIPYTPVYI